jgi:hypothetical protein
MEPIPGNELPGYDHSVPTGQKSLPDTRPQKAGSALMSRRIRACEKQFDPALHYSITPRSVSTAAWATLPLLELARTLLLG